jgi:hypothetical protein
MFRTDVSSHDVYVTIVYVYTTNLDIRLGIHCYTTSQLVLTIERWVRCTNDQEVLCVRVCSDKYQKFHGSPASVLIWLCLISVAGI